MKKTLEEKWYVFKSILIVTGIIIAAMSLVQCKSKMVISSREDYHLLDELKKFEYEFALHEGIKHKLLGDYPRALFFLGRCLELFPFSDVSNYELSKIYFLAGENSKATDFASNALELVPGNQWYHHHLARLYIETGDNKKAIAVYENAAGVFPGDINLHFTLAALYSAESRFDDALMIYDRLEELIGIDEQISLPRERIYMVRGEYEKAHHEIQKLIAEFPYEARYYGILAELYTSMEMYSEALDSYKILFTMEPDNGLAQLSVADFYLQQGNYIEAEIYLITAFRNPDLDYADKINILSTLVQDGSMREKYNVQIERLGLLLIDEYPELILAKAVMSDLYIYTGAYDKAVEYLDELHATEPDNIMFAEQYIAVLSFNEEYDKVIDVGREMIRSFDKSVSIHYFLGAAYHVKEENEPAIRVFENSLTLAGINPEIKVQIYSFLGDLLNNVQDYKNSDKYFDEALKIDGNNVFVLNNYAYYLALRGENLDKALAFSKRTIEKQPENSSFLDTYAWILYKMGDFDNALLYIDLAYKNGGDKSYEIVKHYGLILVEHKRYKEAIDYLLKARELTDDRVEIDEIISEIRENY
jgi:tetratricopeptide (TPR) repeat protein